MTHNWGFIFRSLFPVFMVLMTAFATKTNKKSNGKRKDLFNHRARYLNKVLKLRGGIRLIKEHIKGLIIISSLLTIAGLVLMFSSISFGTSLGSSWLLNQEDGIADTSEYDMVVETHKNNFVIAGSILFGTGLLTAILTYFTSLLFEKKENNNII